MSKINYINYKPDASNLQTPTALNRDQEKLMKEVDGSLTCAFYKF